MVNFEQLTLTELKELAKEKKYLNKKDKKKNKQKKRGK